VTCSTQKISRIAEPLSRKEIDHIWTAFCAHGQTPFGKKRRLPGYEMVAKLIRHIHWLELEKTALGKAVTEKS
jgi:hypothetical protein